MQTVRIVKTLKEYYPELEIDVELNDSELPFPCGHSILRVEGASINSENIIAIVNQSGLLCEILEDKVCK